MTTENRQGLIQNRSLYHQVCAIRDTTVMQNPKGNHYVLIYVLYELPHASNLIVMLFYHRKTDRISLSCC